MDASITPFLETPIAGAASPAARTNAKRVNCLLTLEKISVSKWDATVGDFDGVCQEMTAVFAQNRWPGVTIEPVLMMDRKEPVAGALVMVQRLPLGLANMAVVKWGPALKSEAREDAKTIYAQSIELLIEEYAKKRGMMLSLMARAPRRDDAECFDFLVWRGFRPGSALLFPNRYMVDLKLDDAAQRKSLLQKWRYHLNKSEKEGLVFEHAGPEKLEEFDALYHAMADRKKFPDYSAYHTVPKLMATEVAALRPELFFVRKDGEAVAGAIIFKAGRTAVYLYGATNDKALPLRAGYFMHWHIIRWLGEHTRAEWYDLGGTDGFQGLHQFKKGMAGTEGLITPVPPITNYASHPLAYILGTSAYAARDGFQKVKRFVNWMRNDMARPNQER